MKKLFTFLLALMASSCLWAEITYELDGGKYNDYDWNNKSEMFAACMAEAGVTGLASLDDLKAAGTASFTTICTPLNATKCQVILDSEKWEWLEQYIMSVQNPQKGTIVGGGAIAELIANTADAGWRFAIAAFFLEMQNTAWPRTADFSEAGKDAAYIPAWGQNYPSPEHPTEEVTLHTPFKEGYKFLGWYDNPECTGTPITTVNASTTGTLYAKWVLDGIVYELNGGVWNEYGWTSKKDMYDAFLADWKAYSGSTKTSVTYEEQLGAGNSKNGIPAVMYGNDANGNSWKSKLLTFFTDANYSAKWGWLATYLDVVAATQYKKMNAANGPKIQPSTNGDALAYSLGNFFGEDNYYTTNYIDAVEKLGFPFVIVCALYVNSLTD